MKNYIKKRLLYIWEGLTIDPYAHELILELKNLKGKYSHIEMFKVVSNRYGDRSWVYHYFAKAGFEEAEAYLDQFIDADDEHTVYWAAIGLAYYEREDAFRVLHSLANKTHPHYKYIHHYGDILEELKSIDNSLAKEMVKDILGGMYDDSPPGTADLLLELCDVKTQLESERQILAGSTSLYCESKVHNLLNLLENLTFVFQKLAGDPDWMAPSLMLGSKFTDAGFAHLSSLTGLNKLTSLNLMSADITDQGLAQLPSLAGLTHLSLEETEVTSAGLVHISALTGLTKLNLSFTKITDEGLAHLAPLTKLTELDLSCTEITDEGLAHLSSLTGLTYLDLQETQVTDIGLAHLTSLIGLIELNLEHTDMTADGLAHLSPLTELTHLYVPSKAHTDKGLTYLSALKKLTNLDLSEMKIADVGRPTHMSSLRQMNGQKILFSYAYTPGWIWILFVLLIGIVFSIKGTSFALNNDHSLHPIFVWVLVIIHYMLFGIGVLAFVEKMRGKSRIAVTEQGIIMPNRSWRKSEVFFTYESIHEVSVSKMMIGTSITIRRIGTDYLIVSQRFPNQRDFDQFVENLGSRIAQTELMSESTKSSERQDQIE